MMAEASKSEVKPMIQDSLHRKITKQELTADRTAFQQWQTLQVHRKRSTSVIIL